MLRPLITLAAGLVFASNVVPVDPTMARQLNSLTSQERREQRCDVEAMARIAKADSRFDPDKVIAHTFGEPVNRDGIVKAPGAVFRSRGEWYRLKYKCETDKSGLNVISFDFKIGSKVDRTDWRRLYLYN